MNNRFLSSTLTVHRHFETAKDMWTRFERNAELYVFQSYDWLYTWHDLIGRKNSISPRIVILRNNDDRVVLILPLCIITKGLTKYLTWLGGKLADYHCPILCRNFSETEYGEHFDELWPMITSQLGGYDIIYLDKQPETINGQANPMLGLSKEIHEYSFSVNIKGSWDDFYKRVRKSRLRADSRRKKRRLSELGELKFVIINDAERIKEIVQKMIEQKRRRYDETFSTDLFADNSVRKFFHRAAESKSLKNVIQVSALICGKTIVATHWGMMKDKRFYWYMPSFESGKWHNYSSGRLLLENLLEWSFENGVEIFDFTIGGERYKHEWCDQQMKLFRHIEPIGFKGRGHSFALKITESLRENSLIYPILRKVKYYYYRMMN